MSDARARADALVRALRGLADAALRVEFLCDLLRREPVELAAGTLEVVCARAEQAEVAAREALVAVVDALNRGEMQPIVQRLREQAAGESLLALERLLRAPPDAAPRSEPRPGRATNVPADGHGRPLTLGERKSLARRPDRSTLEKMLRDPHPDVIHRALRNPRLTEDDVVRLAARRPCPPDVLAEIAREPKWMHNARVRRAIILNPSTPLEIATRVAGLLVRQELLLVIETTHVPAAVRAICLEHLERRPPIHAEADERLH